MKIGFFGNTNNYPFLLAQGMQKLGHEAVLIINSTEHLHRPENRCPEFEKNYPIWIVDGSTFSEWDYLALSPQIAPILDLLSRCEVLILNSFGPSFLPLLKRPAIAFLTGSDLDYYANFETIEARSATWNIAYKTSIEGQTYLAQFRDFVERQRGGIQQSAVVYHMPRGVAPANDALLDDIGVSDVKRVFIPLAELEQVKASPAPKNQPIRIFCATRLTWKLPVQLGRSSLDYKASDVMIRGLGLFYRETGAILDIRLVRKGLHIAETEKLVIEEGLAGQVTWLEEMTLATVWDEFAQCDIVIEQLGMSMIGMAGFDAMASGRPVIGNVRPEITEKIFHPPPPICQAKTAEDVCIQLKRLVFDPIEREKVGKAGRQFVEEYCSPIRGAREFLHHLQEAMSGQVQQAQPGPSYSSYLEHSLQQWQRIGAIQTQLQAIEAQLQATQTQLQATQTQLQTAQTELAHYRTSRLIQLVRRLAGV